MSAGIVITLVILIIVGIIFAIIATNQYDDEKMEKLKQEEIRKQKEFQQILEEIKPDKVIGDKDLFISFKGYNIVTKKVSVSLKDCAYYHDEECMLLMFPSPNDFVDFEDFAEEQRQEIVDYLDKYNIPEIQAYFKIRDKSELQDKISFNKDYEYAYMVDEKDKLFQISGSKDPSVKWKLTNIEFSPHYVTDYEVTTESEENGRINGHAGAAALGGIIGGTTGAVIGSSLGRGVNSTTVSHSSNSAQAREIPSTALLTIESSNGDKLKLAQQFYEETVIFLKKYFLVENENEDSNKVKKENTNLVTELQNLKQMMDEGAITEEEFKLGKKKLLEG